MVHQGFLHRHLRLVDRPLPLGQFFIECQQLGAFKFLLLIDHLEHFKFLLQLGHTKHGCLHLGVCLDVQESRLLTEVRALVGAHHLLPTAFKAYLTAGIGIRLTLAAGVPPLLEVLVHLLAVVFHGIEILLIEVDERKVERLNVGLVSLGVLQPLVELILERLCPATELELHAVGAGVVRRRPVVRRGRYR